jgi:hypothetical protein
MTPYSMCSVLVSRYLRHISLAFLNVILLAVFPAWGAGWTDMDIGGSSTPGSRVDLTNGWRVQAAGREIGGAADQFYFSWREEPGDFDYAVRIGRLDNTDVWAKAGLMLRESLEPGAGFAGAFASPSLAGCFMQTRRSAGAVAQSAGSHPANFPETWLRLKRVGSDVTAYAGLNGENWEVLGTTQLNETNATYFGSAVCSRNTNALCTAEFYDLRAATDFGPPEWPYAIELPGPSSRRTSLAITEIMYNPGPHAQGYDTRFIEIFNSNPFFEDISGFRLAGTIDYTFPDGTIIEGGHYLVVAAYGSSRDSLRNIRCSWPIHRDAGARWHAAAARSHGGVLLRFIMTTARPGQSRQMALDILSCLRGLPMVSAARKRGPRADAREVRRAGSMGSLPMPCHRFA